ncbi:MAG TPA: response regulator transcription factor [Proteobacteria bacterium]|nr:response regulator transcription factor [Pseudomonadota bacterium]
MSENAAEWLIYIVGSGNVQGELLAIFLEKETGLPCRNDTGGGLLPASLKPGCRAIVFSDCKGRSVSYIVSRLKDHDFQTSEDVFIALFNVDSACNVEEELLRLGVWGVFYEEDPPKNLCRGVEAIRNGEIWLSRQLMSSCLVDMRRREGGTREEKFVLTGREREVLLMVSQGLGNDAIAARLCVSIHTVRSHLYRIFKKINVANRQQASIWAARNL